MLKKKYLRDGEHRIIGSVTSGYEGAYDSIVRDEREQVVGAHERTIWYHTGSKGRFGFEQYR